MHKNNLILQHQSHVWVSDQETLKKQVILHLQNILCKKTGCSTCSTCMQIQELQHPFMHWFAPEESYTLEQTNQILEQVKFKLDPQEYRFIIISQAHELSAASCNRLLKTIEEPHAGYYFIFLATRTDTILPTVLSRSFFKEFPQQNQLSQYRDFMQPFLTQNFGQPAMFTRTIDKMEINTQASKEIVDALIFHFHQELKQNHASSSPDEKQMLRCMNFLVLLQEQLQQLPIAGSTKLFWKNLYLAFHAQSAH